MNRIKFNRLNNNCYFLELENKIILISYESIIGIIINDILYLNEIFLKKSKTTTKHINLLKNNLIYSNENILTNDSFIKLIKDL